MTTNQLLSYQDLAEIDNKYKALLPPYRSGYLWLSDIDPAQKYQRTLDAGRVRRLVKAFNSEQINPLKVNYRDGQWRLIDGQHTMCAIRAKLEELYPGVLEDCLVMVNAFEDKAYQDEALLFAEQQLLSKQITAVDTFFARLEAGQDLEKAITIILASKGLRVARGSGEKNAILAVNNLISIFHRHGPEALSLVIDVILQCWNYDPESLKSFILTAVDKVLHEYGNEIDLSYAIERWGSVTPQTIRRQGKEFQNSKNQYARALVDIYNEKRKKNKLDRDRLMR